MTKESYYEICELLGSEPIDSEIPVEYEDLLLDIQEAMLVYRMLPDNWDVMNGTYTGKNYIGILDILSLYGIEDAKTTFMILRKLDESRIASIKPQKSAPK